MYAIIENGGKQYKAVEGSYIELDLLPDDVGKKKTFDKVLLLATGEKVEVGDPYLSGISVDTTILSHFKGEKITVFKYRPKQRYRVKTGHRQKYSRVIVDSIAFPGKSADKKKATPEKKEETDTRKKATAAKKAPAAKKSTKSTAKKSEAPKKSTAAKKTPSEKASPKLLINDLDLGKRATDSLTAAGVKNVDQILKKLEGGDSGLLDISGVGNTTVTAIKKKLRSLGYKLPKAEK